MELRAPLMSEQSKFSKLQPWLVVFSCALFFFYEFIQMNMFSAISPDLMAAYHLNAEHLGLLSTTYLIADTVFLLPAGLILDRFSTRTVVFYSMLLCVLSTAGFAFTHNIWMAGVFHFLTGIGNAFCFLACVLLASRWFPPRKQGLIIGLVVTLAFLGGSMAQTPMAFLANSIGWRDALFWDAGLGLVILALILINVRDYPIETAAQRQQERLDAKSMGFGHSIKLALSNKQNWMFGIYISFLNLPIMVLDALWGGLYLSQVHHIAMTQATFIIMMIFVGSIFGCPLAGWFSDSLGMRKQPMILGGIISLLIMGVILLVPNINYKLLIVLFFGLGFFTSTQVIGYPAVAESNPETITSTATGFASTLIMGGAAIAQPLFGWLMDLHWSGKTLNGAAIYSASNYNLAMLIFPIAFTVALAALWLANETFCQPFNIKG